MVASGINKLFWIWTLSQGFLLFIYPIQGKKKFFFSGSQSNQYRNGVGVEIIVYERSKMICDF